MLTLIFAAGLFAGPPIRDRRMEIPAAPPPRCLDGVNGECSAAFWGKAEPSPPVRDCPEGFTMGTVRPGVRYCVLDRTIRQ